MALKSALDTGQVHQSAASGGFDRERGAAVVRTGQSFDDVAEALADQGYEATDGLMVSWTATATAIGIHRTNTADIT